VLGNQSWRIASGRALYSHVGQTAHLRPVQAATPWNIERTAALLCYSGVNRNNSLALYPADVIRRAERMAAPAEPWKAARTAVAGRDPDSAVGLKMGDAVRLSLHPDGEVTYVTLPKGEGEPASLGGLARFSVERAGVYSVGVSEPIWIDIARDGKAIEPVRFAPAARAQVSARPSLSICHPATMCSSYREATCRRWEWRSRQCLIAPTRLTAPI